MATEKYLMENYKRFLLNRTTVTTVIVESIENCLTNEDTTNRSFHKIMVGYDEVVVPCDLQCSIHISCHYR